ncbi:hypothetical protein [Tortoise microvirus 57]|nr:hypothetical protein [Tortoise microvirus 57]
MTTRDGDLVYVSDVIVSPSDMDVINSLYSNSDGHNEESTILSLLAHDIVRCVKTGIGLTLDSKIVLHMCSSEFQVKVERT